MALPKRWRLPVFEKPRQPPDDIRKQSTAIRARKSNYFYPEAISRLINMSREQARLYAFLHSRSTARGELLLFTLKFRLRGEPNLTSTSRQYSAVVRVAGEAALEY